MKRFVLSLLLTVLWLGSAQAQLPTSLADRQLASQTLCSGNPCTRVVQAAEDSISDAYRQATLPRSLFDRQMATYTLCGGLACTRVVGPMPSSFTIGDLLYASSSTQLASLADVAAGSYLRAGGVATAPVWSTTTLPNSATTGDLLHASGSNAYGNLSDVAVGQVLTSAGTGTLPAWSGAPLRTAGGGTQTYHQSGTLYWERVAVANAADTLYVSTTAYSLPAGTLATTGDRLDVEVSLLFDATAATRTIQCNLGYTAWDSTTGFTGGVHVITITTTATSTGFKGSSQITRLGAASEEHFATALSGTTVINGSYGTSSTLTWANAYNVLCHAKSSVATAGVLTLESVRLTWHPYR